MIRAASTLSAHSKLLDYQAFFWVFAAEMGRTGKVGLEPPSPSIGQCCCANAKLYWH